MAQLNIRVQNEDGDPVTRSFHLDDEHADEETEQLQSLAEQAQLVPALREEKNELESELETVQEVLISDIIRRKKLAGELEGDGDIEEEREFLQGLPATRLKKHWNRAPKEANLDTEGSIEMGGSGDNGSTGDSVYDEVGL